MSDAGRRFATEIVHGGEQRDQYQGALLTPIVRSAPYVFETLEALDRHASGEATCWEYARTAHPTGRVAEAKLAALEGAEDAVVFASGMAAITGTYLALLRQGDHLLVTDDGYKRTLMFARDTLPRWGVEGELVDSRDPLNAVRRALRPNTRLVLVEMPTNPHLRLVDLRALADLCHQAGALLAVDSTLASPVNLRPLALGADLVLHSATKFLAGHNDVLAGAVCGPADLITTIRDMHVNLGAILDPEGCYLLLRGLKTLGVRLARSNASALALAQWLAEQPQVAQVYYPGLPSDPGYELAQAQMASGGSLVSFELRSDLAGVARFVDALEVIALGTSLGGVESLLLHLGVLLRHGLTPEDRARLGLTDQLLRLSVGLEDPGDLLADLARGLAAMG